MVRSVRYWIERDIAEPALNTAIIRPAYAWAARRQSGDIRRDGSSEARRSGGSRDSTRWFPSGQSPSTRQTGDTPLTW